MGLMVDTDVFIEFEKRRTPVDLSSWNQSEEVHISAVSVSELLIGVHRADNAERSKRRSEFVEAILANVSVLDFSSAIARLHAKLFADLAKEGRMIGAHDLIIAATALHHGLSLLTNNVNDFSRIHDLNVIQFRSIG